MSWHDSDQCWTEWWYADGCWWLCGTGRHYVNVPLAVMGKETPYVFYTLDASGCMKLVSQ